MIVGTAGHIDHGKTALVRALTGIDTDRLPAEKARGLTIDLGFAYRPTPSGEPIAFVDVPGHEGFVHNMLAGAAGIDFALLVVAADDGPMPQTREHLHILDLLGIGRGIVVLSKCDLVGGDRIAAARAAMRGLLAGTGLAAAEILPVSAVSGEGLAALEARLTAAARSLPSHRPEGRFRLAVDRSFSLAGIGTVATGTVFAGAVCAGERLIASPSGLAVRVRAIHTHGAAAERAHAGQRCALNLVGAGVEKDRLQRGEWILDEVLHAPTGRLDARIRLLPDERHPLRHEMPVYLHLGAARTPAHIALLDCKRLPPGEQAFAHFVLDRPLGALYGDRIVFRDPSARRTMGGGIVLDPWPQRRARGQSKRLKTLAVLEESKPAAALSALLSAEPDGVDLDRFSRARNLTAASAAELWRGSGIVRVETRAGPFGFGTGHWQSLAQAIAQAVAVHHDEAPDSPGIEPHRLKIALAPRMPLDVFAAAIAAAVRDRRVQHDGRWIKLPGHAPRMAASGQRLWERIRPIMNRAAFQPPRVRELARLLSIGENEVRELLRWLARTGDLREVAPDHFFPKAALVELAEIVLRLAGERPNGLITAADFRDAIGTGRKLAIAILEFFDRDGMTVRQGDRRTVRRSGIRVGEADDRPRYAERGCAAESDDVIAAKQR